MATDVSAPLPDLTLEESSLLVIDTGDNSATITGLVIHVSQEVPDDVLVQAVKPWVPTFVYKG